MSSRAFWMPLPVSNQILRGWSASEIYKFTGLSLLKKMFNVFMLVDKKSRKTAMFSINFINFTGSNIIRHTQKNE